MSLSKFNFVKKAQNPIIETEFKNEIICKFTSELCDICNIQSYLSEDWNEKLKEEFAAEYFTKIIENLHSNDKIYPPIQKVFYFSHFFPMNQTRVVIIGQDPYHNIGRATGLAFHVPDGIRNPPSLENIFKEVRQDYKSADCNLLNWAKQGVLLLNDTLTVTEAKPNSHSSFGWSRFTDKILKHIDLNCENVVFLLWGQFAAKKRSLVDESKHLVLISSHPSPFSVLRGFKGCGHFSKVNEYFKEKNKPEINW